MVHLPTLKAMLIDTPQSGAKIEGRERKKGWSMMEIATYTDSWQLDDYRTYQTMVPNFALRPMQIWEFQVTIETFLPLFYFKDVEGNFQVRRFEAINNWMMTYQEILRHLAVAETIMNKPSSLLKRVMEIIGANQKETQEAFCEYSKRIAEEGIHTMEQFLYYVKEHVGSTSPFFKDSEGLVHWTWSQIDESPVLQKECFAELQNVRKTQLEYASFLKEPKLCSAAFAGPAARSRESNDPEKDEIVVLGENGTKLRILVRKWKGRKAGSLAMYSLWEWSIYGEKNKELKDKCYAPFYALLDRMLKTLKGATITFLARDKVQFYDTLQKYAKPLFGFDLHIAEKIIGLLLWKILPIIADLSDPEFKLELGPELYSGLSFTGILSEWLVVAILEALYDEYKIMPNIIAIYRDGFALDIQLPESELYGNDGRIAGFMVQAFGPGKRRFGPPSFVTDNPDNRVKLDIGRLPHKQWQREQYIMRPATSVLENSLFREDSCAKYIEFIMANKLVDNVLIPTKDAMHEQMVKLIPDAVEKLRSSFANEFTLIENYFMVQKTNPQRGSDIRIYP